MRPETLELAEFANRDLRLMQRNDDVLVRGLVVEVRADGKVEICIPNLSNMIVSHAVVAGYRMRPIKAGDRVKAISWGEIVFTVLATHRKWAWLADADDSVTQEPLDTLRRVS